MPAYETIYRHKQMGQRVGTLTGIKAGDLITFCTATEGFHTRTVGKVNEGAKFLVTRDLIWDGHTLRKAQEVTFSDIREVLRPKKNGAGKGKRRGR